MSEHLIDLGSRVWTPLGHGQVTNAYSSVMGGSQRDMLAVRTEDGRMIVVERDGPDIRAAPDGAVLPGIFDGGTGRDELVQSYQRALDASDYAVEVLRACAPDPKDYLHLGPRAIHEAMLQHLTRVKMLELVKRDLEMLVRHLGG